MSIDSPETPSLPWRLGSSIVIGMTGIMSRAFLLGASKTEVHGLDDFLHILDRRKDVDGRERGLLTGTSFDVFNGFSQSGRTQIVRLM